MARQKSQIHRTQISTKINSDLLTFTRLMAVSQDIRINIIFEKAIEKYDIFSKEINKSELLSMPMPISRNKRKPLTITIESALLNSIRETGEKLKIPLSHVLEMALIKHFYNEYPEGKFKIKPRDFE